MICMCGSSSFLEESLPTVDSTTTRTVVDRDGCNVEIVGLDGVCDVNVNICRGCGLMYFRDHIVQWFNTDEVNVNKVCFDLGDPSRGGHGISEKV